MANEERLHQMLGAALVARSNGESIDEFLESGWRWDLDRETLVDALKEHGLIGGSVGWRAAEQPVRRPEQPICREIESADSSFRLVEISVVVAIVAILASMTMKGYGWIVKAKAAATAEQVRVIHIAAQNWKADGGYADYTRLGNDGLQVLIGKGLVDKKDVQNAFGGINGVRLGMDKSSITVFSNCNDGDFNSLVADEVNSVHGASVCHATRAEVDCTFSDASAEDKMLEVSR